MNEHARNIRNMIGFGVTVGPVQTVAGVPSVQVRLTPIEVLTLRVVEKRGLAVNMPVGTPVVALFHGGDRSNGVVMGSTSPGTTPSARPALTGDEDSALYGHGFMIAVLADGIHFMGAPKVFMDGDLLVKGEVTAMAGGNSVTLSQHVHPDKNQKPTPYT